MPAESGVAPLGAPVGDDGQYEDEDADEGYSRIAHARWSLTPDPGMDRELAIKAGEVSSHARDRFDRRRNHTLT